MTARKPTTNNNIRDLIDDLRLEIKSDIKDLSIKVDNIDKAQAVSSTKVGMIVAAISLVVSALVSAMVARVKGGL